MVAGIETGDALGGDVAGPDARAETEARHDRQLIRGVKAFDVVRGVGLGVAEALGVGKGIGITAAAKGLDALPAQFAGGSASSGRGS